MSRNLDTVSQVINSIRFYLRWDMADVEKTFMTEVNRFLMKHRARDHFKCNKVPSRPQPLPIVDTRNITRDAVIGMRKALSYCLREGEIRKWGFFENVQSYTCIN